MKFPGFSHLGKFYVGLNNFAGQVFFRWFWSLHFDVLVTIIFFFCFGEYPNMLSQAVAQSDFYNPIVEDLLDHGKIMEVKQPLIDALMVRVNKFSYQLKDARELVEVAQAVSNLQGELKPGTTKDLEFALSGVIVKFVIYFGSCLDKK